MNSSFLPSIETGRAAVGPSILSADFTRLEAEVRAVEEAGADFHHIDVMDGHFVPNITFGPMIVEAIARLATRPLVTHLMISDPGAWAVKFAEAGSALVSFHFEAVGEGHEKIVDALHGAGRRAGLAINPDTPLERVRHLLGSLDLLLLMTVFPGFGGQSFMGEVVPKIAEAAALKRSAGYRYLIEVDGGINPRTAELVRGAGGECLVAGTAVYRSPDYASAIAAIRG
ncbi:MAG: ribulose-phosphate 3-epimerase [Candidatus Krumholzibacteria bacterium]|nr:ribulose-phosphate 3-epimerase [Candidatus Krumholzibacteria bacterium]